MSDRIPDNNNKDLTGLRYTIPQRDLKHLGYKMLHRKDGYILEIEQWVCTIWIWLAGKTIHVNDWYDRSYDVIEFYKANKDKVKDGYLHIAFNYVTGDFIVNNKFDEIDQVMSKFFGQKKGLEAIREKYKPYDRDVYLKADNMDKLIIELEKLKPAMIYAGTPVS